MQKRRRSRNNRSTNPFGSSTNSTISLLRRDMKDHHLFNTGSGLSSEPDPLISSFVSNAPLALDDDDDDASRFVRELGEERDDDDVDGISSEEDKAVESVNQQPSVPKEDLEERTQRTNFVQGLVLSTLFDDFTL
ncbi:hypothetical protein LUZ60_011421 [Juncus effusus]|nr:hypothetical protein LUZ60_011421 [Juncus effusus]